MSQTARTERERYEQSKYEVGYCDDCGEKRCPPQMNVCPYCHPNADYEEDDQ